MSQLLYYPLVTPPREIIAQALLYWDGLGSISPGGGYGLSPTLERLHGDGVYTGLDPTGLSADRVDTVAEQLVALLEALPAEKLQIPDGPLTRNNRLYAGKLPDRIEADLLGYGLLEKDLGAYRASGYLLAPLLAIVAREMAENERPDDVRDSWVSHTDIDPAHLAAYAPGVKTLNASVWQVDVGRLFPPPAPDTDLADLIMFHKNYEDERRRFITCVDQLVGTLGGSGNPNLIPQLAAAIEDAHGELTAAARSRGIKLFTGSTAVVLGVEAGILAELPQALPGLGMIGGLLLSAGVNQVRRGKTKANPYTYLTHVRTQFPS